MNEASPIRQSACPGLYRLAPARDGGICRVKVALGTLDAAQARALAAASRQWGNGIVEITSRANLQLRGIAATDGDALARCLLDAGLGATSSGADDVRNVMVSPSYGIDDQALLDTAPIARALLSLLDQRADFHALSPKFSILVDGGEATAPLHHPNDIWLAAATRYTFALGLGGTLLDFPLGTVQVENVVATLATIIERFLATGASRMRQLGDRARELTDGLLDAPTAPRARASASHFGIHPQSPAIFWIGARPPLGRMTPEMLEGLATLTEREGDGTIRLTPHQSVILPGLARPAATLAALEALGLVTAPDHPLSDMLACSGSAGCRSALADTQRDALMLAGFGIRAGLHLSGCEKSCASAQAAPHTLVAVAPGRYDLYRRADGAASRFGEKLASSLTVAGIARKLAKA
ncbi:precorrin-3B synthase [Paradevosia shaoguanensis]|uniref:Precorrin-3B synthase n=1 Tax=Paradevosia shaoguanensis TaxID=1335043 RepID=A0AA41QQ49_9HYPH|nr:precorrin-3B synthase [Paradevosia shaoguanensis]MCF1744147.1 precorrin-3B synthase [Paradevosia shaoguanensis]MCI0128630.1 precorrin-3B synthase [Paradevosia shaoguanensis]